MAVSGTINVSASFLDLATASGFEAEKKITMSSASVVTGGKVAVVSGTVGTAIIEYGPPEGGGFLGGYRDAAGDYVSFNTITGFALRSDAPVSASQPAAAFHFLVSDNNEVVYTRVESSDVGENFRVQKLSSGTCNFSLLIYGT
jgi:hypothetical protein